MNDDGTKQFLTRKWAKMMSLNPQITVIPQALKPGENPQTAAEVAQLLGHTLPPAMTDFLAPIAAPAMFEKDVRINVIEANPLTGKDGRQKVLMLYGMTSDKDGLVVKHDAYKGRLARRSTPFAEDGLGNLFVVDAVKGQVHFWHHECPHGEDSPRAMTLVANDFAAFLSGLEVVSEASEPAVTRGVKSARFDF